MANKRISKEKQVFILAALCEGTPINAVCRMFKVGNHAVLRIVAETGEALADYMDKNFRDLPCKRIEMDEQWQYVGMHGQRMAKKEAERGDFWTWACIDADTKLVFSHRVGKRKKSTGIYFMEDVRSRVTGNVQIATDNFLQYPFLIRGAFGYEGYSYGTETKVFGEPDYRSTMPATRPDQKNGIPKIVKAERKAVAGSPDLASLTTCHIERAFLTVRQELKRYQRQGLGYSKDLEMHKLATALHFGIYNLVRRHKTLKTTPAVAAGVEQQAWGLERVVDMTEAYWKPKFEAQQAAKAIAKRMAEDAMFLKALAQDDNF